MVNCCLNYFLSNKRQNSLIIIAAIAVNIGNSHPTLAQITPDTSLGNESSVVTPDVEIKGETGDRIDGGAIRDRNLFHSFSEFNVEAAQRVYFANPNNIEQIFTRVAGNNPSNINGTLGVDGAADLLLLNPNGIIFGENSSLDIEGSFFGTSADSVLFEDNTEFSAAQPDSLLTISVPVGLQMGNNPGSISVRSPLEVGNGQNFTLVGGEIGLSGGDLTTTDGITEPENGIIAPGGRVELASLSTAGIVSFENNSNLSFSKELSRANITFNDFLIDTSAGGGGSVAVFSQNLRLTNSEIVTGIDSSVESTAAQAGDITIDTVEATILEADEDRASGILNVTGDFSQFSEAIDEVEIINTTGNAGNIFIDTGSLSATGSSFIGSLTNGEGNAGNIDIIAKSSVSLDLLRPLDLSIPLGIAGIVSVVGELGTGNSADIQINTPSLSLNNFSISTTTTGAGNAGNTIINAENTVVANNSLIISDTTSSGNGGTVQLNTRSLSAENTVISTSTVGAGDAGNSTINATDSINFLNTQVLAETLSSGDAGNIVFESGTANISFESGTVISTVVNSPREEFVGTGRGGNITLKGRNLVVRKNALVTTFTGGQVTADGLADAGDIELNISDSISISNNSGLLTNTTGVGNAGNLTVNSDSISISDNSGLSTNTTGVGNAGNLTVNSDSISISDNSGLNAVTTGAGNAGGVSLNTEKLTIENGFITTSNGGTGQAGNLNINASKSVGLSGTFTDINGNNIAAGLFTATVGGNAAAGNLTVNTKNLQISAGARIQAGTFNAGNGGNITITTDEIQLTGNSGEGFPSSIIATTNGSGNGGVINIATNNIIIANEAGISVRSVGDGNAGEIFATVNDSVELENGFISSRSDRSSAGEIAITAGDIRLKGDSNIQTNVENGAGGGGNITLSADSIVAFDDSDIFSFAADGVGGNITLDTDTFFGANYTSAALNANPQLLDNNSRVDLNASGSVFGIVDIPNVNFLPNSLVELSEDTIDTDEVVANSCVVRKNRQGGTFIVAGSGGLRSRPGDAAVIDYATGTIRSIPNKKSQATTDNNWQPGDPIVEPEKAYRLSNGKLVLSRQCS